MFISFNLLPTKVNLSSISISTTFLYNNRTTQNKKVLLRELKSHTTRRVASARYAALSPNKHPVLDWGGGPHPVLGEGYPIQAWTGGTLSSPGCGGGVTPSSSGWGVPQGSPSGPGMGYHPHPDLGWGTPSVQTWEWGTPHPDLGMGYPPVQTWDAPPPSAGWGTPPRGRCVDWHTKWKYYLPPSLGCGR